MFKTWHAAHETWSTRIKVRTQDGTSAGTHKCGNYSACHRTGYVGTSHIDGLAQERRNSSALAMELRLSCTNPSIYHRDCSTWDERSFWSIGNVWRRWWRVLRFDMYGICLHLLHICQWMLKMLHTCELLEHRVQGNAETCLRPDGTWCISIG